MALNRIFFKSGVTIALEILMRVCMRFFVIQHFHNFDTFCVLAVNLSNDEFTCNRCESTFVEELDQGIEEFRNVISEDRSSNDNESETEGYLIFNLFMRNKETRINSILLENRDLLRQIMERVVGMQNQLGRTSPTDLLLPSNGSGPIGIIIRSPSLPPDILRGPNPVLLGGGSMMLPVSAATRNGAIILFCWYIMELNYCCKLDARGFPEARDGSGILGLLNTLSLLRPGTHSSHNIAEIFSVHFVIFF